MNRYILKIARSISAMIFLLCFSPDKTYCQELFTSDTSRVINTGYDTCRARNLTGSVSIIGGSVLTSTPEENIVSLLQGRASGINVRGSGEPGDKPAIRIRGFSSFQDNEPLYIVDGIPVNDISYLNPGDIDHILMLKDAGSSAIYGGRGSAGVIVLSTRKGSQGLKVNYNMSIGTQLPGKGTRDDILNAQEYADLQWLVYKNDGTTEVHPIYGPSSNPSPRLPSWAANTDWYKAITKPALITNHNLSVSGRNKIAGFYAGIGYFKQDGIIIYTDYTKYTGTINSDFHLFKNKITAGENISFAYRLMTGVPNLSDSSPISMGPYRSQTIIPVIITEPVTGLMHNFVSGEWGGTGIAPRLGNADNEVATLTRDKNDQNSDLQVTGQVYLNIKILEGLTFRTTYGSTTGRTNGTDYSIATYEKSENLLWSSLRKNGAENNGWNWTNMLTFSRKSGNHSIDAIAGFGIEKSNMGNQWTSGRVLSTGTLSDSSYYTLGGVNRKSQFLRTEYNFMGRYFISATVRNDASSVFTDSLRNMIFPSVSAAWIISEEKFLKGLSWMSFLKIRGSCGLTGNEIPYGNTSVTVGNPYLKYEKVSAVNFGFDAAVLNEKIELILDWYSKTGNDLFLYVSNPYSGSIINSGSMKNSGIDLQLSCSEKWGGLQFKGSVIFTTYKNNIEKIAPLVTFFDYGGGTTRIGAANRNMVGHPMSAFYGYKVIGLFQSSAEVASSPTQDGAAPGFFKYQDTNGDGAITPDDRVFIGNPNPKFTYGINLGFTYKKFDLTAFLYGSQGNDIFNWNAWWTDFWPSFQGQKSKKLLYESWTPERTNTTVPMASNKSNFSTNTQVTSYYIEDGSFLRLKNLQLGYTLPETLINKFKISHLRVYVQAVNLFTITRYSGLDPEIGGDDRAFGSDTGNYPQVKQMIFGINLAF